MLTKDYGFASLLAWVCTHGAGLAHAPSFVAPPVLAVEALVGFLLGEEPPIGGVPENFDQDPRLLMLLTSWPRLLLETYRSKSSSSKPLAVPMPPVVRAVDLLLRRPEFARSVARGSLGWACCLPL